MEEGRGCGDCKVDVLICKWHRNVLDVLVPVDLGVIFLLHLFPRPGSCVLRLMAP